MQTAPSIQQPLFDGALHQYIQQTHAHSMRMFDRDWHFILLIHLLHKKVQTIMPHHVTHVNKAFIVDKLLLLTSIIVLPIIVLIFVIAPSDWISDLQN